MSHVLSGRWLVDRRRFLRGAGVAVALPLLNSMQPRAVLAKNAAPRKTELPRRSVFVYIPNGVNVESWKMDKAGADYDLSVPLQPLERHKKVITPISGLYHGNGLGQGHVCADSWLTGAALSSESSNYKNSVSCDQVMAEVTGPLTRFPSLELSITAGVGQPQNTTTLSYSRDGVPLPAEESPRTVFERLFGTDSGGAKAQEAKIRSRQSVLDAISSDARSFRSALGHEDTQKLDEYLNAVREVEIRTERMEQWLNVPKPQVNGDRFLRDVPRSYAGDYYRTMYDLIVLALQTDMTRVVTYMSGSETFGLALPELHIRQSRHELSHHNGDPETLSRLTRSDTFLTEQLAYFLDRLHAVQEDGVSLLDRTMVLYGSGMSYGHSHGNANLPTVFAGGAKLGIKHGQHLDYNLKKLGTYEQRDLVGMCFSPIDRDARLSNLLLTMLHAMNVPTEKFADSLAPISEVLA